MHQSVDFCVQNALKLTYEHLQVKKNLLGSLALAMRGGEEKGWGKGEGKGKEGEREGMP